MEYVDVAVIGGGQSGLAAAHVLRGRGLAPVVLEASGQAVGSWRVARDAEYVTDALVAHVREAPAASGL
ncbi:NAD(P)-binding protein [Streptomyces boluensis]|uniref:NAD(P)-binding protein n=1 Tax=Streptomyces boluensis TaxID=1775135 RepID=UPI00248330ED|nr:NAD(P)-binding protein [Streptomyces boluensis]